MVEGEKIFNDCGYARGVFWQLQCGVADSSSAVVGVVGHKLTAPRKAGLSKRVRQMRGSRGSRQTCAHKWGSRGAKVESKGVCVHSCRLRACMSCALRGAVFGRGSDQPICATRDSATRDSTTRLSPNPNAECLQLTRRLKLLVCLPRPKRSQSYSCADTQ